jgi:hypothetical protein
MSKPLQISPETALKLSKELKVPLEHLMHMPKHILLQKLAELAARQADEPASPGGEGADTTASAAEPETAVRTEAPAPAEAERAAIDPSSSETGGSGPVKGDRES